MSPPKERLSAGDKDKSKLVREKMYQYIDGEYCEAAGVNRRSVVYIACDTEKGKPARCV